jgi:hypothetical protein
MTCMELPGHKAPAYTFIVPACIAIALTLAIGPDVFACSCIMPGPPCQSAWNADAVFSGTVVSIQQIDNNSDGRPWESRLVTFNVQRGFINGPVGTVDIVTGMGGGDCGYQFKPGVQYLVYASKSPTSGRLSASICSRTKPFAEATEDLRYLTTIGPTGSGGRVFGRVNELRRDPAESEVVDYGPVEGIMISVRGAAFARDAVTDADGRFDIAPVPLGKATFTATLPLGFEPRVWETELEIRDPRACFQIDLPIQQSARASGVVVDAAGRAVGGVMVDAVAAELAGFNPPQHQYPEKTNERGEFHFDRLPPGTYVFGINLTNPGYGRRAGTPVFLPGTRVAREAAVIELKAGESRELGALTLPR